MPGRFTLPGSVALDRPHFAVEIRRCDFFFPADVELDFHSWLRATLGQHEVQKSPETINSSQHQLWL